MSKEKQIPAKGLVVVNTGDGKGKTTAALGIALRAVGWGMRVLILQFIKGSWKPGEVAAAERLAPELEVIPLGEGFVDPDAETPDDADVKMAQAGLEQYRKAIESSKYDVIVLDEINYAVKYGFLTVEDVLEIIRTKPEHLHLVLTGRDAAPEIVDAADTVTEMREIKHPFQKGSKATKGIDF